MGDSRRYVAEIVACLRGALKKKSVVVAVCALLGGTLAVLAVYAYVHASLRVRLWREIRPIQLVNCTLERIGSKGDGGYVMCANLMSGVESAYSYGIEGRDDWGCVVSSRLHLTTHEYDCFDLKRPPCANGKLMFHEECIGPKREQVERRPYDSLQAQIAANGDRGKRLIVKMDVEGAEWETFLATPDDVLATIDQMSVEFHGIGRPIMIEVFQKLKRNFYVVDIHFNNTSYWDFWGTGDIPAPFPAYIFETLLVNKRLAIPSDPPRAPPVNPLHHPNVAVRGDCQVPWD